VMSHWTIDPSLGCCDESLNHWSKSEMLWWISKLLIQVWDAVMNLKTIDPSLGCCDESLYHSSISGMNELSKSVVVPAFVRTTDWKPVLLSLVVEAGKNYLLQMSWLICIFAWQAKKFAENVGAQSFAYMTGKKTLVRIVLVEAFAHMTKENWIVLFASLFQPRSFVNMRARLSKQYKCKECAMADAFRHSTHKIQCRAYNPLQNGPRPSIECLSSF